MNLNILAYFLYFIITTVIIIYIGFLCFQNGNTYIEHLLPQHLNLALKINQILLLSYYLLNIGYCATTLIGWKTIISITQLLEVISYKMALILIIIGVLHYLNILVITAFITRKI
ncbi:hypothetical protein ACG2LH_04455 [Zhouia sp. PK063]|uniref:hypothetical protein n=1 Tax=Zhouia sp. PK063 TaxID=3373602 RepID=UPI003789E753